MPCRITHVFAADLDPGRAACLAALARCGPDVWKQRFVHVGGGAAAVSGLPGLQRVHAPFNRAGLLRRAWVAGPDADDRCPQYVHVWSRAALDWVWAWERGADAVVIEVAESPAVERDMMAGLRACGTRPRRYVTRHAVVARMLAATGIAPDMITEFDAEGLPGTPSPRSRDALRAAFGVGPTGRLLVVLPPLERAAGVLLATWGALVCQKVAATLRVVIAGGGHDAERVQRLVVACRHETQVFSVADVAAWPDVLRVADAAIALHAWPAPLYGAATALALGVPLIATNLVRAGLGDAPVAAICEPHDAKDVARAILHVIEAAPQTQTPAGMRAYGEARILAAYAAVYDGRLAARR